MAVSLVKGQKVDLIKKNPGLKNIMVALGWDEVGIVKKFLIFSVKGQDIDCDASAILCDQDGKIKSKHDIVYFGNLRHKSGAVKHMGDNLTGAGDGDAEQIMVNLSALPSDYHQMVFVVNIYQAFQRKQHFGMVKNAYIRIVDTDTNKELCRYNLSENYDNMTAMVFGKVYKQNNTWNFDAIGEPTKDASISQMSQRYM